MRPPPGRTTRSHERGRNRGTVHAHHRPPVPALSPWISRGKSSLAGSGPPTLQLCARSSAAATCCTCSRTRRTARFFRRCGRVPSRSSASRRRYRISALTVATTVPLRERVMRALRRFAGASTFQRPWRTPEGVTSSGRPRAFPEHHVELTAPITRPSMDRGTVHGGPCSERARGALDWVVRNVVDPREAHTPPPWSMVLECPRKSLSWPK